MLEKDPKFQGAAQRMYEGTLKGLDKEYFGVVMQEDAQYVFTWWKDLELFKASGAAAGFRDVDSNGRAAIYVGAPIKPESSSARLERLRTP